MATPDHDRVGKALHLLKEGLGPFVEREVKTALDRGRLNMEAINEKLRNNASPVRPLWNGPITDLDIAGLLRIMRITWKDVFSSTLKQAELNLVHDLSTYRNKWAHQEKLSSDDVYRVLDSSERLLRAINAIQEAEILAQSKREQLQTLLDNSRHSKNELSEDHIEVGQTSPSQASGSVVEDFLQRIHKVKTNHKGKPEELTREIAKIILKELGIHDEQIVDEFQCHLWTAR